ncbi:MAG: 3-deoxy-7-phosphoheptulonate synthase, partial [Chloroflexota bacterium]
MIVQMRTGVKKTEVDAVVKKVKSYGWTAQISQGTDKTVIAILGTNTGQVSTDIFAVFPGVENVTRIMKPYKLASREVHPKDTLVNINGIEVGGKKIVVMAGPCAVENEKQLTEAARVIKDAGAVILRGGAFKPRTSPFSFQGLQEEGVDLLIKVKKKFDLPVVTEVVDAEDLELVSKAADILQIGSRNMQNYSLLTAVGKKQRYLPNGSVPIPVVLKRGFACTVTEWLTAADYLLAEGN